MIRTKYDIAIRRNSDSSLSFYNGVTHDWIIKHLTKLKSTESKNIREGTEIIGKKGFNTKNIQYDKFN